MAQAVDIQVILHAPVFGDISHTNLLSLIDERRARLEAEEEGNELGAGGTVFRRIKGEAADRAWLIVILEVKGVPAVIVDHEPLPFSNLALELAELPCTRAELAI